MSELLSRRGGAGTGDWELLCFPFGVGCRHREGLVGADDDRGGYLELLSFIGETKPAFNSWRADLWGRGVRGWWGRRGG